MGVMSGAKPSPMVTVEWEKDEHGQWYSFVTGNLDLVFGSGVCIVWYESETPATVCVGHGDLPQTLHEFCESRAVTIYRKFGTMRFTWIEVPIGLQLGIARYLTEQLQPIFGDTSALVPSIAVNLPE